MHYFTSTFLPGALLCAPVMAFVPAVSPSVKIWRGKKWTNSQKSEDDMSDFDPLLSPHAYPNGIDGGAVTHQLSNEDGGGGINSSFENESVGHQEMFGDVINSSSRGQTPSYEEFDPTLSPHDYPDGVDAGVVVDKNSDGGLNQEKLGILLIDHGSKREASNKHLHNIAEVYQFSYNEHNYYQETVVRGAHMEIATPSIITSLRELITVHQVTRIVCVPYFLSPGRHATTDVPNLIAEAKNILDEEGVMTLNADKSVQIIVSDALGTHTESMLSAVDKLVDLALEKQRY